MSEKDIRKGDIVVIHFAHRVDYFASSSPWFLRNLHCFNTIRRVIYKCEDCRDLFICVLYVYNTITYVPRVSPIGD